MPSAGTVGIMTDIIAVAGKSTRMAAEAQMQGEAAGIGKPLQIHQLLMLLQLPSCINQKLYMVKYLSGQLCNVQSLEYLQSPSLIAALHDGAICCPACAQVQQVHE